MLKKKIYCKKGYELFHLFNLNSRKTYFLSQKYKLYKNFLFCHFNYQTENDLLPIFWGEKVKHLNAEKHKTEI